MVRWARGRTRRVVLRIRPIALHNDGGVDQLVARRRAVHFAEGAIQAKGRPRGVAVAAVHDDAHCACRVAAAIFAYHGVERATVVRGVFDGTQPSVSATRILDLQLRQLWVAPGENHASWPPIAAGHLFEPRTLVHVHAEVANGDVLASQDSDAVPIRLDLAGRAVLAAGTRGPFAATIAAFDVDRCSIVALCAVDTSHGGIRCARVVGEFDGSLPP
mmetsp:Transcript_34241/g.97949  ORF Transcript_34241/g.97949 Transcript_34241/m.97949 type:complete len:217 (+) Transcript_34241:320-970(+)